MQNAPESEPRHLLESIVYPLAFGPHKLGKCFQTYQRHSSAMHLQH
jgi:hypothetical protein